ncbi:MAG: hypothetical protein V1806_14260 [Pseudomonadota bacterium]
MSALERNDQALIVRVRAVRGIHARQGAGWSADPRVAGLAGACRREIAETWRLFREMEVARGCAACDQITAGGCCFAEVGQGLSRELLLVNLVLGVELPLGRLVPGSCFFVGPAGCRLLAREAFCINYFCPRLESLLGPDRLTDLRRQAGREIMAVWELERELGRRLSLA